MLLLGSLWLPLSLAMGTERRTFDCQVAYQVSRNKVVGGPKVSGTTNGSSAQTDIRITDERYEYHFEIVGQTFQIDVVEKRHRDRQSVCIKGGSGPYISYQFPTVGWVPTAGPAKGQSLASVELFCTQR
jgi:hypothetical protein